MCLGLAVIVKALDLSTSFLLNQRSSQGSSLWLKPWYYGLSCATTHLVGRLRHTVSGALSCDMPGVIEPWYKLTTPSANLCFGVQRLVEGEVNKVFWTVFLAHSCPWPTDTWCLQRNCDQLARKAAKDYVQDTQLSPWFLSCLCWGWGN